MKFRCLEACRVDAAVLQAGCVPLIAAVWRLILLGFGPTGTKCNRQNLLTDRASNCHARIRSLHIAVFRLQVEKSSRLTSAPRLARLIACSYRVEDPEGSGNVINGSRLRCLGTDVRVAARGSIE